MGQIMEWTGPRPTIVGAGIVMAAVTVFFITTGRLNSLDDE